MSEIGKSRVLVIGGTRGAGLLIARLLHQRGYQVRVLVRNPAAAELGVSFEVVAGDLTKAETLPAAVADVDHIIFTAARPAAYAPSAQSSDRLSGRVGHDCGRAPSRIPGRFVYLTRSASGLFFGRTLINLSRGTRRLAPAVEDDIRATGLTTRSSAWASCSIGLPGSTRSSSGRTPCRWRLGTGSPALMSRRRSSKPWSIRTPRGRRSRSCGARVRGERAGTPYSIGSNRTRDDGNCGDSAGLPWTAPLE